MPAFLMLSEVLRRRGEAGGCGLFGCFGFIVLLGLILFLVMRGRRDRPERLGASKRTMGSGPIQEHRFACPYTKCPTCAASAEKMKQQWDGLRKVTWTCGYCGNVAGVQDLQDDELPPSARQRLGLDLPPPGVRREGFDGDMGSGGMGGAGGLLTGMMIGSMLGGGSHTRHDGGSDGWGGSSDSGGDWGDSSGDSDGSSGGDWGDSGGDSGGDWGDSGGGDSGGDW